jgi:hypothetical protein
MPSSFPPWHSVYRWFARLCDDGTWETINHHLVVRDRERMGREASLTAAVVDSQSVKTAESRGTRSYAAGKKIKELKRHALLDTGGRALKLHVHSADIQDRDGDGAGQLLPASRPSWPLCNSPLRIAATKDHVSPRAASSASRDRLASPSTRLENGPSGHKRRE